MSSEPSFSERKARPVLLQALLQCYALAHAAAVLLFLLAASLCVRGYSIATQQHEFRAAIDKQLKAQELEAMRQVAEVYDPSTKSNQTTLQFLALVEAARYDQALSMVRSHRLYLPKGDTQALDPIFEALSRAAQTAPGESDQQVLVQSVRELLYRQNLSATPLWTATVYTYVAKQSARFKIGLPPLLA